MMSRRSVLTNAFWLYLKKGVTNGFSDDTRPDRFNSGGGRGVRAAPEQDQGKYDQRGLHLRTGDFQVRWSANMPEEGDQAVIQEWGQSWNYY